MSGDLCHTGGPVCSSQPLGIQHPWVKEGVRVFIQDKHGILDIRIMERKSKVQLRKKSDLFYMVSAFLLSSLNQLASHTRSFCMCSLCLLCYLSEEALKVDLKVLY